MRAPLFLVLAATLAACDPGVRLGATCERTGDCPSPLVCGQGRCRAECRESVDCALGALCRITGDPPLGTCELPDEGCPAAGCGAGLVCVEEHCANECDGDPDCATGNVCVDTSLGVRACVLRSADAGPRDAGDDGDAGPRDAGDDGDAGHDSGPGDAGHDSGAGDAAHDGGTSDAGAGDPFEEVVLGEGHACARTSAGRVVCWGLALSGQVGPAGGAETCLHGSVSEPCSTSPVAVAMPGDMPAIGLVAGQAHTCARLAGGGVACWGGNSSGELGIGAAPASPAPVLMEDASAIRVTGATALGAGRCHGLVARATSPFVLGVGCNGYAQLGDETTTARGRGVVATAITSAVDALAGGGDFSCLRRGGAIECWGENQFGQIGADPATTPMSALPITIDSAGRSATHLATGAEHACARYTDGTVWCWGRGSLGELGDPVVCDRLGGATCWTHQPVRVLPADGRSFVSVAAAATSILTCAIDGPGAVLCWGNAGVTGFFASGSSATRPIPVAAGLPEARSVALGGATACAVTMGGEVWCWGDGDRGQLGRAASSSTPDPTPRRIAWP